MKTHIRRGILALMLTGLLAFSFWQTQPVQAGGFSASVSYQCTAVDYTVGIFRVYPNYVRVYNDSTDELLGEVFHPYTSDTFEFLAGTIVFAPQGNPSTLRFEVLEDDDGELFEVYSELSPTQFCDIPEEEATPSDGRFCFAPGEARVAIYPDFIADDPGIGIWRITDQNTGVRVIEVRVSELNALGDVRVNTLVSEDLFSAVKLYKLTNGWYQINAGPYGERKIHACVFNSIPPTQVIKYTIEY